MASSSWLRCRNHVFTVMALFHHLSPSPFLTVRLRFRSSSSYSRQSAATPLVKTTFCSLYQECSELQNPAAVRQAHARMITIGFIPTIFVANCLIHAYIRCTVLENARKVFDDMPSRDTVSWNAVISGYTQNGLMREAQSLFNAMPDRDAVSWNSMISGYFGNGNLNDSAGVFSEMMKIGTERPDRTTIAVILKLISALEEGGSGVQIHVIAVKTGLDTDVVAGSALVDMYAKCRSLTDALRFFSEMPEKNWVSWSTVIGGCTRNNRFMDAFRMFVEMQREGIETNQSSYASIFRSCAGLACLEAGKQLHGHALKSNFMLDVVVGTAALDMYAKCRSLWDAVRIFRRLPDRSLQTFNAMLVGFLRNDRGIEALNLFMFMNFSHIVADEVSLSAALSACAEQKAHSQGMQIHCLVLKSPHGLNVCVMNAVLDMYGKCGDVIASRSIFEEVEDRDEVSWNALITALEQNGFYKETLTRFNQMVSCGLDPDDFTYGSVLKACTALQSARSGMAIHNKIIKSRFTSDSCVGAGLIDMYCKCGMLEEAEAIHRRIESRTMVSWNSIISGFSFQNESEQALKLFNQMLEMGLQPDNFTYATILDTCANLAVIGLGRQLHAQILKQEELHDDVFISSTLVDMYAKCGNMQDSLLIFHKMSTKDFVSWNAVICGFANHGLVFDSLTMFESMKAGSDVTPTHATFVAVLRACGHAGLLDEGRRYFESMRGCHNLEPQLEHYSCMVDLIGRCEGVHEALGFMNGMPYEPDAVIWRAVLSACQIHENAEVAELALKEILQLEPDDSSACILLSNIYAEAGRWDEVCRMRKMMRSGGMKKEPGCSWIEVENEMHAFTVGDHAHPRSDHMFNVLDSLFGEMILTRAEQLVSS